MKKVFWLLDVNYEVREEVPQIWMWGISEDGERMLIFDNRFQAYCYAVLEEGESPKTVMDRIMSQKEDFPSLTRLEPTEKRFFGKPVKAIKVVFQNPEEIPKCARKLGKIKGVQRVLEDDIRYSMRYLVDNDVYPCGWHEIEVEKSDKKPSVHVDGVYLAKSYPHSIENAQLPKLRVLGFSIICYSPKGTPKPDKDPVVVISTATNNGIEKQFVAKDSDDKAVIEAFIEHLGSFDPDIIVGFETNRRHWNYLLNRSKELGIKLFADRAKTEPHRSLYGHVSITGRANIDLFEVSDELPEVKTKTLENVADFLGVMKLEKRTIVEDVEVAKYYKDAQKLPILLRFSKETAQSAVGVAEAMMDFTTQLSYLVGLPLDQVASAAVGFRIEWFLIREAYKIGELVPERVERPYFPYAGAVVLEPRPGVHENIAVLDFKSLYPNIMITKNVSPDAYVPPEEPDPPSGVNVAPEVGYRFRKEPTGFYKEVLSKLIRVREGVRSKMKELDPKSPEYRALDARQRAVKVITNAAYGYTGWIGARWYIKPVAESAAAWGRDAIQNTVELAKKIGLEVVYGDTDSIFIKNEPEKVAKLSKEIHQMLGLETRPDKIYTRVLFTEAKKKYCGLLPDGQLDIVGLEVIRGDWAIVAKKVQEEVLNIVLRDKSPEKAVKFVRQFIAELRQKKVPYRDLIIWKTLSKPVKEYAVKAPHVEAAKTLAKEGWHLTIGDKIGYVITTGSGRLYQKAKPYSFATYDEVDLEYYVTNQVVPAASRILALFGIKEENLLSSSGAHTLSEFMKS
jgi:DNA polymerase I